MPGTSEQRLAGRYRLLDVLGRGGMGIVWRARDEYLERDVAVKEILLPQGLEDEDQADLLQRFLREARAAARLDHPGIIAVYDVIAEEGLPWIVMRLVRGRSLDRLVREDGALPPGRVAAIGLQILDALAAAHAEGVLHRDVTPRNVLIGKDDRVVLTDFGIASIDGATALTQTGALIGSPGYIAPERLRGHAAGPESDLWALGATLYFAVEGRPAYTAREIPALIGMVLTDDPRPAVRAGPLAPALKSLLARHPADRPTAEGATRRLREVTEPQPRTSEARTRTSEARTEPRAALAQRPTLPAGRPSPPRAEPVPPRAEPVASRAEPVPSRRRRWIAPGAAALVVLAALFVWDPFGFGDGRFRTVPVTCGGVSPATVDRLVPHARPSGSCQWVGRDSALDVYLVRRFERGTWRSAPARAHDFLASTSRGAARVPVGDEATARDALPTTTVCFRVSNLVVLLYYTAPSNPAAHADAVSAAGQMAEAIKSAPAR